jgi:hypothetical protein
LTHTDKGNYAAKHQTTGNLNASVVQAVQNAATSGEISCAAAHKITRDCSVSPAEAGREIDTEEVQITHCQLGIFKHSANRSTSSAHMEMTPEIELALTSLMVDKRLTCEAAWSVADRFGLTKLQVGAACDQLGIKIKACQLGTFG